MMCKYSKQKKIIQYYFRNIHTPKMDQKYHKTSQADDGIAVFCAVAN